MDKFVKLYVEILKDSIVVATATPDLSGLGLRSVDSFRWEELVQLCEKKGRPFEAKH